MTKNFGTTYIAFLRGINVGGHKSIKMGELKNVFELLGFKNVKTLIASGNVIFETLTIDINVLSLKIEGKLKEIFGHEISIILRTIDSIQEIVDSNPFESIELTKGTKLYVSFLIEKPKSSLKIPYQSTNFSILKTSDTEVFSVLDISKGGRTVDGMNILEKEFGKKITTRNWNTICKLLKC